MPLVERLPDLVLQGRVWFWRQYSSVRVLVCYMDVLFLVSISKGIFALTVNSATNLFLFYFYFSSFLILDIDSYSFIYKCFVNSVFALSR